MCARDFDVRIFLQLFSLYSKANNHTNTAMHKNNRFIDVWKMHSNVKCCLPFATCIYTLDCCLVIVFVLRFLSFVLTHVGVCVRVFFSACIVSNVIWAWNMHFIYIAFLCKFFLFSSLFVPIFVFFYTYFWRANFNGILHIYAKRAAIVLLFIPFFSFFCALEHLGRMKIHFIK